MAPLLSSTTELPTAAENLGRFEDYLLNGTIGPPRGQSREDWITERNHNLGTVQINAEAISGVRMSDFQTYTDSSVSLPDKQVIRQAVLDTFRAAWLSRAAHHYTLGTLNMRSMNLKMMPLIKSLTDTVMCEDHTITGYHPWWYVRGTIIIDAAVNALIKRQFTDQSHKLFTDLFSSGIASAQSISTLSTLIARFPESEYAPMLMGELLRVDEHERIVRAAMVHGFLGTSTTDSYTWGYVTDVIALVFELPLDKVRLLVSTTEHIRISAAEVSWLAQVCVSRTVDPHVRELVMHAIVRGVTYPADTDWRSAGDALGHMGTPELVEELFGARKHGVGHA